MSKTKEHKEECGVTSQYGRMSVDKDGVVCYQSMDAINDGRPAQDPSRRVITVVAANKEELMEITAFFMHVLQDHMDVDTGDGFTEEDAQQLDPRLAEMLNIKNLH